MDFDKDSEINFRNPKKRVSRVFAGTYPDVRNSADVILQVKDLFGETRGSLQNISRRLAQLFDAKDLYFLGGRAYNKSVTQIHISEGEATPLWVGEGYAFFLRPDFWILVKMQIPQLGCRSFPHSD